MGTLRRRVPLGAAETASSFASRLAAANHTDLGSFYGHMGLSLLGVTNGETETLECLAHLTEEDPRALAANTLVKVDDGRFRLHGQALTLPALRRRRPWFCPLCARDDIRGSTLVPRESVFCRSQWIIEPLRTCALHEVALLDLITQHRVDRIFDFSSSLSPAVAMLDRHCADARSRRPSDLERYLIRRLDEGSGGNPWLDSLAFNAVALTAERVGAVAAYGPQVRLSRLSPDDWWAAGDIGHAIMDQGEAGLTQFLNILQNTFEYGGSGVEKAHAVFGALYEWLDSTAQGPEFNPIRTIVREHILSSFPVASGTRVFGEVVPQRRVHSIRSAARETGRHMVRLRLVLAAEGLLPPDHEGRHDALVLFDALKAEPVLRASADTMGKPEVEKFLGSVRAWFGHLSGMDDPV